MLRAPETMPTTTHSALVLSRIYFDDAAVILQPIASHL
jgi:hypothetical protein